jgi:hypothetical protein
VNWDEQTDLNVAGDYAASRGGLVYGSEIDAINTRLPMYTMGVLLRLHDDESLLLARLLSVFLSALTIVGVYVFCRLELDRKRGLIAALLLATSPYFLFFGKLALTEGDVWITLGLTWVLVAAAWYRQRRAVGRLALLGLAVGLAMSAKISGVALVPAAASFIALDGRARDPTADPVPELAESSRSLLLIASTASLAWVVLVVLTSFRGTSDSAAVVAAAAIHPVVRWTAGLLVAIPVASWVIAHRNHRLSPFAGILLCVLVAGLVFLLIPPVHVTNPHILAALRRQLLTSSFGHDFGFTAEAGFFHFATVAIKSSPVIGLGLWAGLVFELARIRSRPGLCFPVLAGGFYCGFLLLLPWAQTMYMRPVLPALTIIAADAVVRWHRRSSVAVRSLAALAALVLLFDITTSYPDLNLVGHPWLGERYLAGRSTLGYRGIVQTGADGIEQSLQWVSEHATPEENIITVYGEVHITEAVLAESGLKTTSMLHEPADLREANWVITSLNWDIEPRSEAAANTKTIYGYPHYDRSLLEREFEKVFAVDRAYGVEVAAVWQRRDDR